MSETLSYKIFNNNVNSKKLLILLHGYGSDENDLFSLADKLPSDFFITSLRAPYSLSYGGYSWFDINLENLDINVEQAIESKGKILKFIDFIINKHKLSDEICLIGFSQGAIMSFSVSFDDSRISKVVAICGFLDNRITNFDGKSNDPKFLVVAAEKDEIVPMIMIENSISLLDRSKCDYKFNKYDVGHSINDDIMKDTIKFIG